MVRSEALGVVLQDMNFHRDATSGEEGEALLHAIRKLDPDLPVVLMTAFQSLEAAVRLVRDWWGACEERDAAGPASLGQTLNALVQRNATQRQSIARRTVVVERALASIFRPQTDATYARLGDRPSFASH